MKILYLEDDLILSETIEEFLHEEGYEVVALYDGEDVLNELFHNNFDLLIFDVQVPSINGFELLKELRSSNINTLAIFTTSLNSIDDISIGYEVGADDYIRKPFLPKELLLRIKALLKREFKVHDELIEIGENISFNMHSNELYVNNKPVVLNLKETLLLKILLKHKNECVIFDELYEYVWSYDETHSYLSLRTYIKTLRSHIGKDRIISIKKIGYKLV